MHNAIQLYDRVVQFTFMPPKGGGNLPPPFASRHRVKSQPYEKFVRLTGTWRKGVDKLSRPLASSQRAHSTPDDSSRVDHIEHVLGMAERAPAP